MFVHIKPDPLSGITSSVVSEAVQDNRPVNLDLTTIRFPVTAISSILHRISGVVLFAGVALLLWALGESLRSEAAFNELKACLDTGLGKLVTWAIVSAVIYHFVAGIKHLIMDTGIGESLEGGRKLAVATLVVAASGIVLAGVWIW
jgi:succinate dehydrogenase / fumarate reductase cytochrome b subunit